MDIVFTDEKDERFLKLVDELDKLYYERIGDEMTAYTNIMGVNIPAMSLPVSPGRSMRALIETAVSNFILKEEGYNSTEEFKERLHAELMRLSQGK